MYLQDHNESRGGTKRFPSYHCCVPVNKILKVLLARIIINTEGLGEKGSPQQRQVFWWVTMASQADRKKRIKNLT